MIHEYTMSNGLKVIGVESHKSPVVSVQMWVRNGSADERNKDEGLSHFIEHLVFKGTEKYKVGEIAALVEACGGEINAYTSFDQTVFYITISKQFYETAMDIIAQMMSKPTFDPEEVDREREVVVEEIKRSQDSLGRRASRLLFSNLYKNHPYAVPVIGYEEVVRQSPVSRIRRFFNERYSPENMFLVVTGDLDRTQIETGTQKYFSALQKQKIQIPSRPSAEALKGKKVFVEKTNFEEAVFYLAWPGVDILSEDLAALECLALIFGQGASSRLYQALRLEKAVVNSVGAGLWAPTQAKGFISISASLNPKHFSDLTTELTRQLEKLFSGGVQEEELEKAKINFLSEEAYTIETVGGLARKYGGNFEATRDIYYHEKFQLELQKVSVADVMRVARKYLLTDNYLLTAVVPESGEDPTALLTSWTFQQKSASEKLGELAKKTSLSKGSQKKYDENVTQEKIQGTWPVFFRQNSAAPVFNLRFATLGGAYIVPAEKAGLAELAGRLWSSQTQKTSEQEMRNRTDKLASSVYSFSGRNTFGLVVDGLTEFQQSLSEIFLEISRLPKITKETLEREKKVMLESLRARKDSPSQIASLQFQNMIFAGHPYAQDVLGSAETLARISELDILEYLQQNLKKQKTVVAASGDFDKDLWRDTLSQLNDNVQPKAAQLSIEKMNQQAKNLFLFEKAEREQTHIIYGTHALTLTDPSRYVLQVVEAVLAGQGGRLFIELRDKASLAYSVSPLRMEGLGTGYFATYIGCSPEKADKAIKMMKEELQKLMEKEISIDELQRAQNYLIGSHDIGLQKNSAIASSIAFNEIYGNSFKELQTYAEQVRAVTARQVKDLSVRLFSQKFCLSVVGPLEPKVTQETFIS